MENPYWFDCVIKQKEEDNLEYYFQQKLNIENNKNNENNGNSESTKSIPNNISLLVNKLQLIKT